MINSLFLCVFNFLGDGMLSLCSNKYMLADTSSAPFLSLTLSSVLLSSDIASSASHFLSYQLILSESFLYFLIMMWLYIYEWKLKFKNLKFFSFVRCTVYTKHHLQPYNSSKIDSDLISYSIVKIGKLKVNSFFSWT